MPSLEAYRTELDYSYAPGIFPSMECLLYRPECVRRILLHSAAAGREGAETGTGLTPPSCGTIVPDMYKYPR